MRFTVIREMKITVFYFQEEWVECRLCCSLKLIQNDIKITNRVKEVEGASILELLQRHRLFGNLV